MANPCDGIHFLFLSLSLPPVLDDAEKEEEKEEEQLRSSFNHPGSVKSPECVKVGVGVEVQVGHIGGHREGRVAGKHIL